ncbi:hypothetical protein GC170_13330 [bacterium]|nr:hypothetical protein [bacterium]
MLEFHSEVPEELKPLLDLSRLDQEIREPGGSDKVEARLKTAIELHPDHGVPLAAWAWFLARNEDYVGAIAWQTKAIDKGPDEFRAMWGAQRAGFRFRAGDWQGGFREFRELIEADPANPVPRIARSFEMRSMGDHVSGELDEMFAMHMVGHLQTSQLFEFFRQNVPFSTLDRLKASLFVLSDPLDATARIHRGEMFMAMGSPQAAFYDLHLADVLQPRNLGLMARMEDIRVRGIMADPPLYDVAVPVTPILPAYDRVLRDFATFLDTIPIPPQRGVQLGWVEKFFGRASADAPFDLMRTSRNLLLAGMAIGMCANLVAVVGLVAVDMFEGRLLRAFGERPKPGDIWTSTAIGILAGGWAVANVAGSILATMGTLQTVCRCRISEMSFVLMTKRWYFRPFLVYGFIFFASFLMLGSMFLNWAISVVPLWLFFHARQ